MTLGTLKTDLLTKYHAKISPINGAIAATSDGHRKKAKLVNKAIWNYRSDLVKFVDATYKNAKDRQQGFLVLQYCTSVVSLEYRHHVWPYEYMALSRRVGELWERFCFTAWEYPSRSGVKLIDAPTFATVEEQLRDRISQRVKDDDLRKELGVEVETLFDLVGEINMKEDVIFTVDGVPHVIDFKSGFGSNEKGNMLRLQTVGKAYKLWDVNTKLLFLVRQDQNNNYLKVIQDAKLWDVNCGDAAYKMIDELTGSDLATIRGTIIDFQADLSPQCWKDLTSHLSDLTSYLKW